MSETDGAILSSIPGKDIYDDNGNKITNIPESEKGYKGWMLPAEYTYMYDVYGEELSTYAQVTANFSGSLGATRHRIIIGSDFNNDGNLGKGKVFDPEYPPYRSLSYRFSSQRNRRFKDVPFMNKVGVFVGEDFHVNLGGYNIDISAGVRYDKVFKFTGGFAPRINASVDLIPSTLSISGAYGVIYNTPNISFLYPENAYFDLLNFNNAASASVPDEQKFQVITTRIFDTTNKDLEMSKTTKYELGLNATINNINLSVTAYRDVNLNGYSFGYTYDSFQSVPYIQYTAPSNSYPSDLSQLPELTVSAENMVQLAYYMPNNTSAYVNRGIEFEVNFGRIEAIRTSFVLNGVFSHNKSWTNGPVFWNKVSNTTDYSTYPNMGVFDGKDYAVRHIKNFTTNLMVTHNIPKIGFIATVTANINWRQKDRTIYKNDIIPTKYISRIDGKVYDIPAGIDVNDPLLDGINRAQEVLDSRHIAEIYPPLLGINVNVTKQFRDFLEVSFFANNMFRSTPLYESRKNPGSYSRRNSNTFFFGLQLGLTIK